MSAKIHAREFGKLAPYLRYKGCQPREWLVAVTREPRLFTQNIGGRQIERLCTAAEACPVLVSESPFQRDEGPVNGGGNYDPQQRGCPIWLYAGTSEYPRVPRDGNKLEVRTIRREGRSRDRNPQRLYARHPKRMMIQSDPHGDVRRSREIVARLIPRGVGHESNRCERNTLSLNWRLA